MTYSRFYVRVSAAARVFAALALIAAIAATAACSSADVAGYRTIKTKETQTYSFSFRAGDPIGALFCAACAELAAGGRIADLSAKWLGGADTLIKPDEDAIAAAIAELGAALNSSALSPRDFVLGVDPDAAPFSFAADMDTYIGTGNKYLGFDVDLCAAVCEKLGWRLNILPVSSFDAKASLIGGNIDCAGGTLIFGAGGVDYSGGSGLYVSDGYTDDGEIYIAPAYFRERYVVLVKAKSKITRIGKLSGKALYMRDDIETINAWLYGEDFTDADIAVKFLPTMSDCLAALNSGVCDGVLLGEYFLTSVSG